jgi:V8-like Glu-specific endopeptidase
VPYPHQALIPLRTILANLYPTVSDARLVVKDARLDQTRIEFSNKGITTWNSILEYANQREKVDDVIKRALDEFPENEQLKDALKGAPPPVIEGPEAKQWNGPTVAAQLEKIIGAASTLVPITYLEIGLQRSRAIARLVLFDGSSGSGFLIDGNTVVTNHHVLPDTEAARSSTAQFNYQLTAAGRNAPVEEFRLVPGKLFKTSKDDDWSAVAVEGNPVAKWGALPLTKTGLKVGDHVNIIQHPGGGPKQISLIANVVVFVSSSRVQYLTDTLPGSSGSPVFDKEWNLVALHHSGGWLTEPNASSRRTYYRNEGIAIDRIIDGLAP